jgi:hypothetical protein
MRATEAWREGWRNVRYGAARPLALAVAVLLTAGGLAVLDLVTVRGMVVAAEHFREIGASVLVVEAPGEVDGVACERLAQLPGVDAAGALRRESTKTVFSGLPQQAVPTITASPGLAGVLGVGDSSSGVWLSRDLASSLGVRPGESAAMKDGQLRVAATFAYPDDGRRPGLAFAVIAPAPASQAMDECWVDSWPMNPQVRALLMGTVSPEADLAKPPTVTQLNGVLGASFDGHLRWEQRVTRWSPLAAAAIGVVLGMVALRLRRLELASARHAGVTVNSLLLIVATELVLILGLGLAGAAGLLCLGVGGMPDGSGAVLYRSALGTVVAGCWGVAMGAFVTVVTIRERDLFAYFKER